MIAQVVASHGVLRDYLALTKPPIIVLLLVTAAGGMFLAARGAPDLALLLSVFAGGALAAGGANALNHALDRDIDGRMKRTLDRPVAAGRVSPRQAVVFGTALNLIAFLLMSTLVNPLSAVLTLTATLIYVFVYTIGLKRTTPQNIVIGGAAGAIPPVVGWVAVTGSLGLPSLFLFSIVFFWTPPHFWALALLIKDDYARAGVPMLPTVVGVDRTKKAILLYTLLLVALAGAFPTSSGAVGWIYATVSAALGIVFIGSAWRLMREPEIRGARSLYLYSMLYLALLFVVIMVDSSIGG